MKKNLGEIIKQDMIQNRGYILNSLQLLKLILWEKYDPMKYLIFFRVANYCENSPKLIRGIVYRIYYHHSFKFGYEISPKTKIGGGVKITSLGRGIVIHSNAIIGENCEIMQNVTVGNNALKSRDDVAIIGDRVTLCAGSKVIGSVSIGDNVVVGANSVVVKDIPTNTIVAGIPAKIIRYVNN